MMRLFSEAERTDLRPARYLEDIYTYCDQSARPDIARVRALLEDWFTRYPAREQAELAARFRSAFYPTFFELFLHELCLRLNAEVEVHPDMGSTCTTHPDFRIVEGGCRAYLEARAMTDESEQERKQRNRIEEFYDRINSLEAPDYYFILENVEFLTERQPSVKRVRRELQNWLDTLDYQEVLAAADSVNLLPVWEYEDEGVRLTLRVAPVPPERRGAPLRQLIGCPPMESRWSRTKEATKDALNRKAGKYGHLSDPYIIAVNCISKWGWDRTDQVEALFGDEVVRIRPSDGAMQVHRSANGWWGSKAEPQHSRVSAVLFCTVSPACVPNAEVCLFLNPWASTPYSGRLAELPRAVPSRENVSFVDGLSVRKILGLEDWGSE